WRLGVGSPLGMEADPAICRRQAGAKIKCGLPVSSLPSVVTQKMVDAGVAVLGASGRPDTDYARPSDDRLVKRPFLAMRDCENDGKRSRSRKSPQRKGGGGVRGKPL